MGVMDRFDGSEVPEADFDISPREGLVTTVGGADCLGQGADEYFPIHNYGFTVCRNALIRTCAILATECSSNESHPANLRAPPSTHGRTIIAC